MRKQKEDVENALRMREMNMEEALDILSPMRNNRDGWPSRHDDHYDHLPFAGQRFAPGPAAQLPGFPPAGNAPNLLGNMNNAGSNSLINNIPPNMVQKMLTQTGGSQGFGGSSAAAGRSLQPQSQPSTQQLKMLVQQIQMAVSAGYLNHQVSFSMIFEKYAGLKLLVSDGSVIQTSVHLLLRNRHFIDVFFLF